MKKRRLFSLVLVLSLVMSTFALSIPALAAGELSPEEQLFNTLINKFSSLKNTSDAVKMVEVADAIDEQDTLLNNIKDVLDQDAVAKQILLNNGLDEEKIAELLQILRAQFPSADDINENNTVFFIKLLFDDNPTYAEYSTELKQMVLDVYDEIPQEVKDDLGRYADSKDDKISFFLQFVNEFIGSKIGTATYDAELKKYTSIDLQVPANFIEAANEILANPLDGESAIQLTTEHKNSINAMIDVIEKQITDAEKTNEAGYILVKAGLVTKNTINDNTGDGEDTGGGSGGSGGESSTGGTTEPEPTVPSNPEEPVTIEIDKDSVTVEVQDGVVNVTVEEESVINAIKAVVKATDEGRKAELVIPVSKTKDANLDVSLPSAVVDSLIKNNVDLIIKSNNIEYNVPADALSDIEIPAGTTVEFKSKEVKAEDVKELKENLTAENKVAKVVELSLEIKTKNDTKKVTKFKSYIVVKVDVEGLGNADKLVVYYVNEDTDELEPAGGKVKDGKIIIKTNHYSKYAIVERNVSFADAENHWAKYYIESMAAKHVIDGYSDGTFKPGANVTRAQFAKMIVNALDLDVVKYNDEFSDVESDIWYADYVATAQVAGLVTGYSDGTFKPNKEISRLEMAVMLSRAVNDEKVSDVDVYSILTQFTDNEAIGTWAREDIAKVIKAGLMNGVSAKEFDSNGTTTRAHAATAIYRLFNR